MPSEERGPAPPSFSTRISTRPSASRLSRTWTRGRRVCLAALVSASWTRLGAVGSLVAVLAIVGSALHLGFYYLPLGQFATAPDAELAARAAALDGHDPLATVALLLFLASALAPIFLAIGLWRAGVLPQREPCPGTPTVRTTRVRAVDGPARQSR